MIGLIAGWFEGWPSTVLMRIADVQLAFPYLLLAIAVIAVLGPSLLQPGRSCWRCGRGWSSRA